ncbi:MAG: hypothetical protein JSS27_19660 [Planctomycetes bacterium]|nr:hypothetical protein [Planctomycetota bacterium]
MPRFRSTLNTLCLAAWPGLPFVWRQGSTFGLIVALGFGAILNGLLLCDFVWTEVASPQFVRWTWGLLAAVWIASVVAAVQRWPGDFEHFTKTGPRDLFPAALIEYLQGNWYETEQACRKLLRTNPRDAEASLLLASALRAAERYQEATKQLDRLGQWTTAVKWLREIDQERARITLAVAEHAETECETSDATATDEASPDEKQVELRRAA